MYRKHNQQHEIWWSGRGSLGVVVPVWRGGGVDAPETVAAVLSYTTDTHHGYCVVYVFRTPRKLAESPLQI